MEKFEMENNHYIRDIWGYTGDIGGWFGAIYSVGSDGLIHRKNVDMVGDGWSDFDIPDDSELCYIQERREKKKEGSLMKKGEVILILVHLIGIAFFFGMAAYTWMLAHP